MIIGWIPALDLPWAKSFMSQFPWESVEMTRRETFPVTHCQSTRWFSARRGRVAFAAAVTLAALTAGGPQALADCSALQQRARDLQQAGDTGGMKVVYEQALLDSSCGNDYRSQLGRAVVRGIERAVVQGVPAGRPLASFEGELADSQRFASSWRIHAWMGDIARERKDYAKAAASYQEALTVIEDEVATPKAPEPAVIEQVFRQAEESRLLADRFVAPPTTRSGTPSGLASVNLRGFKPTKVAVPIEFAYDSTEFTPKGRAAADDLAATLRAQSPATITLVGHTDSRGARDYNMALSLNRANAVAAHLRRGGYTGTIQTIGLGPTEPMVLDDPTRYAAEQIHQINRRVELRR